jgi:hypothetical protein
MTLESQLIVHNDYDLIGSLSAFQSAIAALADRVRSEGEPGVLTYRFYANARDATARATIIYASPKAWIGHHDIAFGWPEMRGLHAVARLRQVTIHGDFTEEIRAWLARSGLTVPVTVYDTFAAGFQRAVPATP